MVNNSIRCNLTKNDIISELKLIIAADVNRDNVYIIVEGEDDIKFMSPYLADGVQVFESYDGKNGVEYIVNDVFLDNARVIGIRDKDYQGNLVSGKIFYYDYNCLEMMIIAQDNVFDKICCEYYEGELSSKELKMMLLKQLKLLSIIRKCNEKEGWGINFKCVSLNKAFDEDKIEINNDMIIQELNSVNSNHIDDNICNLLMAEMEEEWSESNYYDYTQGHDFFKLFSAVCNFSKKRGQGIKFSHVEASARCSFQGNNMKNTELYSKINVYAAEINLSILLVRT